MVTDQDRVEFAKKFIRGAREIAEGTQIAEAREYWQYIHKHGMLIAPRYLAGGSKVKFQFLWAINRQSHRATLPLLYIMPICANDAEIHQGFKEIWQDTSTSHAVYNPGWNIICLRSDWLTSSFDYGCTILHEGGHAKRAFEDGRVGLAETVRTHQYFIEEGDLTFFSGKLWQEKGGQHYRKILDKTVDQIRQQSRPNKTDFINIKKNDEWLSVIDSMLETSAHDMNLDRAWDLFVVFAHLELIERDIHSRKREHRAQFIRTIYTMLGLQ